MMPTVVLVLAVAVFAQGTSEFMLSGMLDEMAVDSGVSLASAGLLTSLFAVGMVIGAPIMAMTAGRLPRRNALAGFLAVFCLSHVIGAVTTQFVLLLATRAVAAVANAGFLAIALAALPTMVGPVLIGRATSVVLSGVTVACIVGVPAGTVLGQAWGWQSAFLAVAVVSAVALVLVWTTAGRSESDDDRSAPARMSTRREWAVLGRRPVRAAVIVAVLVNAGTFSCFTYLGAITGELTDPDSPSVPVVLALFGIGSFIGVTVAGRYGDRYRRRIMAGGTVGLVGVWLLTALTAHVLVALAIMTLVAGAGAFGIGSTLIAAIVHTATPSAPRIAGAVATTAFNLGAVLGPTVAGLTISRTTRSDGALWASVVFTALAATVAMTTLRHAPEHGDH